MADVASTPEKVSPEEVEEPSEESLHEIGDEPQSPAAAADVEEDEGSTLLLLQESFGVTKQGTCVRHPNCPVLSGLSKSCPTRVVSCRVCFSEEKSVGIRQGKTFASVVQELQQKADPGASFGDLSTSSLFQNSISNASGDNLSFHASTTSMTGDAALAATGGGNTATNLLLFLQQPGAMESVMKRLTQVQNWMLRQKEREVLSLQLHIHRLEQRLQDEVKTCQEQRNTVKALRKTIQQDLKIIKTMATQKQMHDEQEEAALAALQMQHSSSLDVSGHTTSTLGGDEGGPSPGMFAIPSPVKRAGSFTSEVNGSSPSKAPSSTRFSPTKQTRHPFAIASGMSMRNVDSSIPIPEDEAHSLQEIEKAEAMAKEERSKNQNYWKDSDLHTMKASNIFQSFRGGLLDIPKSPPRARHDRDDGNNACNRKQKLQLNGAAMDALKLPVRALSRSNSSAATDNPAIKSKEISLDILAATGTQVQRKINGQSPEQFFCEKVPGHANMPVAPALSSSGSRGGKKKPTLQDRILSHPNSIASLSPVQAAVPAAVVSDSDSVVTESYSIMTMNTAAVRTVATVETSSADSVASTAGAVAAEDNKGGRRRATGGLAQITLEEVEDEDATNSNLDATATAVSETPTTAEAADKFVFSVTGATCQDKFGDEGTYTGNILVTEGLPNGEGKMDYESGRVYEGEWISGQWHGRGKLLNPNGDSYTGDFFFDSRHGDGQYLWDNGDKYTGQFLQDKRHGRGKFSFHNGNVYEGEFVDGMFEGFGRYDFAGGYYEGDWKQGRYDGSGELTYANGGRYTGEFRNSVAHGFGLEVTSDGLKRRGVWTDGKPSEYFDGQEKAAAAVPSS